MKILLAIDDPILAKAAITAFSHLRDPQQIEVRVLHVAEPIVTFPPPPQMAPDFTPELADEIKESRLVVEEITQKLCFSGFDAKGVVEKGDARETILAHASQWSADLVVVGSHGRRGLKHFFLGSVAESVARHAPCSVEIVRSAAI